MRKHLLLPSSLFTCFLVFAVIAVSGRAQTTASNEWTWIGGSSTTPNSFGQPGVYGTLGTPAVANIPGGRDSAATWTDSSGNFWLLGGEGVDANGNFGELNDLWEFNSSTNEWTWMGRSSTFPPSCEGSTTTVCGQPGVYGTQGVPDAPNIPGGRWGASHWTDSSGNFWLFGGKGLDAAQNDGDLDDLWKFDPSANEWTWMGGSNTVGSNGGQPGVYGTLEISAGTSVPGGRDSAASWIDGNGNLWLYGGAGYDSQGNYGQLDDLWQLNPSTAKWVWEGGNSTLPAPCASSSPANGVCGWPAIYGDLGVTAQGNNPGSRISPSTWTDSKGNIWLFGGLSNIFSSGFDFPLVDQYDLWEFNPSTNNWTWMGGNNPLTCGQSNSEGECNQGGVTGILETPAISNIPASRADASSWIDGSGNLWVYGGSESETPGVSGGGFCGDIWEFNPSVNE